MNPRLVLAVQLLLQRRLLRRCRCRIHRRACARSASCAVGPTVGRDNKIEAPACVTIELTAVVQHQRARQIYCCSTDFKLLPTVGEITTSTLFEKVERTLSAGRLLHEMSTSHGSRRPGESHVTARVREGRFKLWRKSRSWPRLGKQSHA